MHPSELELQLVVDGELLGARHADVLEHLANCANCAALFERLRAADARDAAMLRLLDSAPPTVDVTAIIARARGPGTRARRRRIAAGIGYLLLAGAAAAMPGSPLRGYVMRMLRPTVPAVPAPQAITVAPDQPAVPATREGIAFVPGATVNIALRATESAGSLRIVLVSAPSVRLTHQGGSVTYTLTADGVAVGNRGSTASFDLAIPETVMRAQVSVGGRTVFTKSGTAVHAEGARDSAGIFIIPLSVGTTQHRRLP